MLSGDDGGLPFLPPLDPSARVHRWHLACPCGRPLTITHDRDHLRVEIRHGLSTRTWGELQFIRTRVPLDESFSAWLALLHRWNYGSSDLPTVPLHRGRTGVPPQWDRRFTLDDYPNLIPE